MWRARFLECYHCGRYCSMVERAVAELGGLEITITNAGVNCTISSILILNRHCSNDSYSCMFLACSMVERVVGELGGLDVAINNAGVNRNHAAEDCSEEDWDLTFGLNTRAVFLCCQAEGRHMLAQRAHSWDLKHSPRSTCPPFPDRPIWACQY